MCSAMTFLLATYPCCAGKELQCETVDHKERNASGTGKGAYILKKGDINDFFVKRVNRRGPRYRLLKR